MLEAPGRVLPRPFSLCLARRRASSGSSSTRSAPVRARSQRSSRGDAIRVTGPLGNGFDLAVARPLLVGGGIGVAPFPYLSERLGRPPALLGFRTAHHAEAAALVPNAEVVLDPTLVTDALPRRPRRRSRLRPGADARRGRAPRAGRPARVRGADGVRLRRLLRLRRAAGRVATAALHRGPRSARRSRVTIPLLNASGCLDPLAAPDVARSLDVVVTKTITPLPRAGNPPVRIAETEHGMLNSIGLAGARDRRRSSRRRLPRLARARRAALGLGRRLLRGRLRALLRAPRRATTGSPRSS